MKKVNVYVFLFFMVSFSALAQSVYFDIGIGIGQTRTELDGQNFAVLMDSSVNEMGLELGLKLGIEPISGVPIYVVGELSGIGHRFEDSTNYIQFNSYLIGPGIIFYPLPVIQIGASIGYSYVANQTDYPMVFYKSVGGIAGNVYVAVDLGKRNNGLLIGLKYSESKNTLQTSGAEQTMSILSVFMKYAYRKKAE